MKHLLILATFLLSANSYAQEPQTVVAPSPTSTPVAATTPVASAPDLTKGLRKRTHAMTWDATSVVTKAKNKSTSVTAEVSDVQVKYSYLYNLGRFEIGGTVSSVASKNEDTGNESRMASFALLGHFNIISNEPGNDLIPYLSIGLGSIAMKSSGNELSGGLAGIGLGLKYFPFSELFALTVELGSSAANIEDNSSPKREVELKQGVLSVGWGIWF